MSRTKSPNPARRITVTMPQEVAHDAVHMAREVGVSLSAFVSGAVRECIAKLRALRQGAAE